MTKIRFYDSKTLQLMFYDIYTDITLEEHNIFELEVGDIIKNKFKIIEKNHYPKINETEYYVKRVDNKK